MATFFCEAKIWVQDSQIIGKEGGWKWIAFVLFLSGYGIEISYL